MVSKNAYTELYFWGCNPSYVATSDGVVMIDTPQQPIDCMRWRDSMLAHGPIRHLVNTEPHGDHIRGNAYFPGVEVIAQSKLLPRYESQIAQMTSPEMLENLKTNDPDSVWLFNHPDFPPNPPTRLFEESLTLQVGNTTFNLIHLPGHTAPQTAVHVPEEGVVFTGDNIFFKCKTFVQEADPWEWLDALKAIEALDVEAIVPGHGEVCDKVYLKQQGEIIQGWIDLVEDYVRRGLSEEDAVAQQVEVLKIDPYPIGQRLFPLSERLNGMNVRNVYKHIKERDAAKA